MGYCSVAILFWSCQLTILWMSYIKILYQRCGLAKTRWDTAPFLLIVSLTPPVQSVDAYVRAPGQSRDNQTKRGWPYSMSMGLCPTRASPAIILKARIWTRSILLGRWAARALYQATQQCTLGRNVSKRCNILYYFWHTESHLNWKTVTHIRFITNIGAIPTKSGS